MSTGTNGLVYECIKAAPGGITSSEICNKYPELKRDTITSAVSKFKNKGIVIGVSQGSNQPALLFTSEAYKSGTFLQAPQMTPQAVPVVEISGNLNIVEKRDSTARIKSVLAPFAKYAEEMLKHDGATGSLHVWLSATTPTPTVKIENGEIFLEALKLMKELS